MKHEYPLKIYYRDTDAGGIVYHANYLSFMEMARTEWFMNVLAKHNTTLPGKIVVRHVELDYLKPAVLGDELIVRTTFESHTRTSMVFHYEIWREKDNAKLAVADMRLVYVDKNIKPTKLPEFILQELKE